MESSRLRKVSETLVSKRSIRSRRNGTNELGAWSKERCIVFDGLELIHIAKAGSNVVTTRFGETAQKPRALATSTDENGGEFLAALFAQAITIFKYFPAATELQELISIKEGADSFVDMQWAHKGATRLAVAYGKKKGLLVIDFNSSCTEVCNSLNISYPEEDLAPICILWTPDGSLVVGDNIGRVFLWSQFGWQKLFSPKSFAMPVFTLQLVGESSWRILVIHSRAKENTVQKSISLATQTQTPMKSFGLSEALFNVGKPLTVDIRERIESAEEVVVLKPGAKSVGVVDSLFQISQSSLSPSILNSERCENGVDEIVSQPHRGSRLTILSVKNSQDGESAVVEFEEPRFHSRHVLMAAVCSKDKLLVTCERCEEDTREYLSVWQVCSGSLELVEEGIVETGERVLGVAIEGGNCIVVLKDKLKENKSDNGEGEGRSDFCFLSTKPYNENRLLTCSIYQLELGSRRQELGDARDESCNSVTSRSLDALMESIKTLQVTVDTRFDRIEQLLLQQSHRIFLLEKAVMK